MAPPFLRKRLSKGDDAGGTRNAIRGMILSCFLQTHNNFFLGSPALSNLALSFLTLPFLGSFSAAAAGGAPALAAGRHVGVGGRVLRADLDAIRLRRKIEIFLRKKYGK